MDSGWMSERNLGIGRFHFIGEGFIEVKEDLPQFEGVQ
jgi:hypothetical protein